MAVLADALDQGGVEPGEVARVRHDRDRAAARRQGELHGLGEAIGPRLPRQRRPDGACRAPVRHGGQERRTGPVALETGRSRAVTARAPARTSPSRPPRAGTGRPGARRRRSCPPTGRRPRGTAPWSQRSAPARRRPPARRRRAGPRARCCRRDRGRRHRPAGPAKRTRTRDPCGDRPRTGRPARGSRTAGPGAAAARPPSTGRPAASPAGCRPARVLVTTEVHQP